MKKHLIYWLIAFLFPFQIVIGQAMESSPVYDARLEIETYFTVFSGAMVIYDEADQCAYEYNPEQCAARFSPCSTFKIPNSVIGLETGVLSGPEYLFRWDGKTIRKMDAWNRDLTLAEAIKVSCVPCYQQVAEQVGREQMQKYVDMFQYGNKDISGDITTFWLGSPLEISAREQVKFLDQLLSGDFDVSDRTLDILRQITELTRTERGILYGKTGSGMTSGEWVLGWFVGFVEVPENRYFFACNITGGEKPAGFKAREITERILVDAGLIGDSRSVPVISLKSSIPADGFYILHEEKEGSHRFDYDPSRSRILVYDQSDITGIPDIPVRYFITAKNPDVPLKLKGAPERIIDDQGKTILNIEMDDDYVPVLERVTREHMMKKQIGMFIGGKMISVHKIRAPITEGKLQISRCSDNACERIYADLTRDKSTD